MPAKSVAQQQAAGIAHAVKIGERPKSMLRGASKQMFQSMPDSKIRKFAKTKTGGLPQKKSEGLTAREMFARDHLMERDDVSKLNLGPEGHRFARMQSKEAFKPAAGGQSDTKWQSSLKLRTGLVNEPAGRKMQSMDKVGAVKFGGKGMGKSESVTPDYVVSALLDGD